MSTPSWITGLSDATLKADFTTFSSAGALTEVEMTKALTDLSAALKSSNKTLSASQLTDLKTIAANIGSMSASPYLQYIVNAFVNGNAANAVWTGGGASSRGVDTSHRRSIPSAVVNSVWSPRMASRIRRS